MEETIIARIYNEHKGVQIVCNKIYVYITTVKTDSKFAITTNKSGVCLPISNCSSCEIWLLAPLTNKLQSQWQLRDHPADRLDTKPHVVLSTHVDCLHESFGNVIRLNKQHSATLPVSRWNSVKDATDRIIISLLVDNYQTTKKPLYVDWWAKRHQCEIGIWFNAMFPSSVCLAALLFASSSVLASLVCAFSFHIFFIYLC